MNTSLTLTLCLLFAALLFSYHIVTQHKRRIEQRLAKQKARAIADYDANEALLINTTPLAVNPVVIGCLYWRMLDALVTLQRLTGQDDQLEKKIAQLQTTLAALNNNASSPHADTFIPPRNDSEAISMLKYIKQLINIVEQEYKKGRVEQQVFTEQRLALQQLKMRVNIENVLKRAESACNINQDYIAQELLERALILVEKNSDPYSIKAAGILNAKLAELAKLRHTDTN